MLSSSSTKRNLRAIFWHDLNSRDLVYHHNRTAIVNSTDRTVNLEKLIVALLHRENTLYLRFWWGYVQEGNENALEVEPDNRFAEKYFKPQSFISTTTQMSEEPTHSSSPREQNIGEGGSIIFAHALQTLGGSLHSNCQVRENYIFCFLNGSVVNKQYGAVLDKRKCIIPVQTI